MDSMDSLGWEMEWGAAAIWDTMWVVGLVAVFFYAMYTRVVGDVIPNGAEHNQDVNEQAGIFQSADAISTSIPEERHESAI